MVNSIVRDNQGLQVAGGPEIRYSNTSWACTGCIDAPPQFVDAEGGDLHLASGSPGIDAGDGDAAPETDIDGAARVDDPATTDTGVGTPAHTDMGAYEYQPD